MNPRDNEPTIEPRQDIQDLEPSTPAVGADPQQTSQTPVNTPPPKSSSLSVDKSQRPFFKKWWPALAGGAVLLLVLVGASIGFAMYQKPENVLLGAVSNAMNAKTLDAKSVATSAQNGSTLNAVVTIKTNDNSGQFDGAFTTATAGKDVKFDTSIVVAKDSIIYVKLGQLNNIAKSLIGDNKQLLDAYKPVIDKVDNKWIKITDQDLRDLGVQNSTKSEEPTKCVQTLVGIIKTDKSQQNKLTDLLKQHPFIKVSKQLADETINGTSSFHYQLVGDSTQLKQFVEGLKKIDIFQNYEKCSGQKITVSDSDLKNTNTGTSSFDVWIGKWSHTFTRATFASDDNGNKATLTLDPTFNGPVDIKTPTSVTPIKDLVKQIQDTFSQSR